MNWAANVIAANPDKEAIISLHGYGYFDSTRIALCAEYYETADELAFFWNETSSK